jgi:hypothetical protein
MATDNFCFYLQNRLIQTSQTGGQWYSDTFPFSIPWSHKKAGKLKMAKKLTVGGHPVPVGADDGRIVQVGLVVVVHGVVKAPPAAANRR